MRSVETIVCDWQSLQALHDEDKVSGPLMID